MGVSAAEGGRRKKGHCKDLKRCKKWIKNKSVEDISGQCEKKWWQRICPQTCKVEECTATGCQDLKRCEKWVENKSVEDISGQCEKKRRQRLCPQTCRVEECTANDNE